MEAYRYLYPNLKVCKKCTRYDNSKSGLLPGTKKMHSCLQVGMSGSHHWVLWQNNDNTWVGGHITEVPQDCPFYLEQILTNKTPPKSFLEDALKCQDIFDCMTFDYILNILKVDKNGKRRLGRFLKKHNLSKRWFVDKFCDTSEKNT